MCRRIGLFCTRVEANGGRWHNAVRRRTPTANSETGNSIMGRRLHIALLIESSRYYGRMLLDGVADYARTFGPWTFYHGERSIDDPAPARLRQWKPDGVIGRFVNRAQANYVRR